MISDSEIDEITHKIKDIIEKEFFEGIIYEYIL